MTRILLFPMALILLSLVFLLIIRLKKMLSFSKSGDIKLTQIQPYREDIQVLTDYMINSLNNLTTILFKSEIKINYNKLTAFQQTKPKPIQWKLSNKSLTLQITKEDNKILLNNKPLFEDIPDKNPWVEFWFGVQTLEECLAMFQEAGLKVVAENSGTYLQRNYIEIVIVSHLLPPSANQAFEICAPVLAKAYGKNLVQPGITVRNFMVRFLINSLTGLPDFLETKCTLFREDEFLCDYFQNATLLY